MLTVQKIVDHAWKIKTFIKRSTCFESFEDFLANFKTFCAKYYALKKFKIHFYGNTALLTVRRSLGLVMAAESKVQKAGC